MNGLPKQAQAIVISAGKFVMTVYRKLRLSIDRRKAVSLALFR